MRIDWRAGAIVAGAAFLLSIVSATAGGVAVGAMLMRALIGAVVFGAGAATVSLLIDRYLPDLKRAVSEGRAAIRSQEPGSRIDIVVDDEPFGGDSPGRALDSGYEDADLSEAEDDDFRPGTAAGRDRTSDEDEPREDEDEVAELEAADDGAPADLDELEQDEAEADDDGLAAAHQSVRSLPDIEGLSDGFADAPVELDGSERSGGSGEDPGIMARAIRTVLKREG